MEIQSWLSRSLGPHHARLLGSKARIFESRITTSMASLDTVHANSRVVTGLSLLSSIPLLSSRVGFRALAARRFRVLTLVSPCLRIAPAPAVDHSFSFWDCKNDLNWAVIALNFLLGPSKGFFWVEEDCVILRKTVTASSRCIL